VQALQLCGRDSAVRRSELLPVVFGPEGTERFGWESGPGTGHPIALRRGVRSSLSG